MDKLRAQSVKEQLLLWLQDNVEQETEIYFDSEGEVDSATVIEALEALDE